MKSVNNNICAAPFTFSGVKLETRPSGLKAPANYTELVGLKVLASNAELGLKPGDIVYVVGTQVQAPWAKARYRLPSGEEAIMVPMSAILLIDSPQPKEGQTVVTSEGTAFATFTS